jgi:hypothetical protein
MPLDTQLIHQLTSSAMAEAKASAEEADPRLRLRNGRFATASEVADQILVPTFTFICTFVNNTRAPIYMYEDHEEDGWKYIEVIEPQEEPFDRTWREWTHVNVIVSNHEADCDMNEYVKLSDLNPEHILKFVAMKDEGDGVSVQRETIVITDKDSSKLDQWKEAALKSQFLLKELSRLGAGNNANYEAIMDMVQDIGFPEHGEQDKERAGVTSEFTNVSLITGIDDSA